MGKRKPYLYSTERHLPNFKTPCRVLHHEPNNHQKSAKMMIDFLRIRTFSQTEIIRLRGLELVPDYPIQGWECLKLNDRIKLRLKTLYQDGEFIGYAFADLSIQPHFIFNGGKHNGNDFTPSDCIRTLNKIFNDLRIQDLAEFQIIGIEFGINVVPETEIKEII